MERALVSPVEIIDKQQQAAAPGKVFQEPRHIVEQAQPLLAGGQGRAAR